MRFITPMWHPNSLRYCSPGGIYLSADIFNLSTQSIPMVSYVYQYWYAPTMIAQGLIRSTYVTPQHAPGDDQYGYEDAGERWMPVHTVETIVSRGH